VVCLDESRSAIRPPHASAAEAARAALAHAHVRRGRGAGACRRLREPRCAPRPRCAGFPVVHQRRRRDDTGDAARRKPRFDLGHVHHGGRPHIPGYLGEVRRPRGRHPQPSPERFECEALPAGASTRSTSTWRWATSSRSWAA